MSKLYNIYKNLKKENSDTLYLFKSGVFYIFLDEDAQKISQLLNLKLTKLNDTILKCGFPISAFDKYWELINQTPYDIKIIEDISRFAPSTTNLNVDISIRNLIITIKNTNIESLSIKDAYDFIKSIKECANKIEL